MSFRNFLTSFPEINSNNVIHTMTFMTCVMGGLTLARDTFENTKLETETPEREKSTDTFFNTNNLCSIMIKHSLFLRTTMSVFYYYLAINVNSTLIKSNLVSPFMLISGYSAVLTSIFIDIFYTKKYFKKLF